MKKNIFVGQVTIDGMPADKFAFSPAGNLAQLGILTALKTGFGSSVEVFSYPPVRVWPRGRLFQKRFGRLKYGDIGVYFPPFIALPILREIFVNMFLLLFLIFRVRRDDCVWIYNMDIPSPVPVILLSKVIGYKIVVFAYDIHLPGETVPNNIRWKYRFYRCSWVLKRVDGVVAITRSIINDFKIRGKSVVLHGGIDSSIIGIRPEVANIEHRNLVFAGRLERDNSIEEIIDAFLKLEDTSIRLIIAGDGPLKCRVIESCKQDNRISYLGKIDHDHVKELYRTAYAILCIRKSITISTPYLFPSKLLEAIGTGALVLSTDLAFEPCRLSDVAVIAEGDGVEAVREGMLRVLRISPSDAVLMRNKAINTAENSLVWEGQSTILKNLLDVL